MPVSVRAIALVVAATLVVAGAATLLAGGSGGRVENRADPVKPSPTPSPAEPAPTMERDPNQGLLLPNVRSVAASRLQIEQARSGRLLRFAAALGNFGPGPLVVRPRRGVGRAVGCPPGRIRVVQEISRDRRRDGRFVRGRDRGVVRRVSGCMLDHPTHDHWHFAAMAAYTLRLPGRARPLVDRPKVSFCLRDNRRIGGRGASPKEYFGDCTANGPQGISPGWVDVYAADLDGQSLRVPPRVDGRVLCLGLEADPFDRLDETDETDNAMSIGIRITGSSVRRIRTDRC